MSRSKQTAKSQFSRRLLASIAYVAAALFVGATPAVAEENTFFSSFFKPSDNADWRKSGRGTKGAMKLGGLGGAVDTPRRSSPETRERVVIKHSPGGSTSNAFALTSSSLVIDGQCLSSCTWAFVMNKNACFTSNARFAFHRSSNAYTGQMDTFTTAYMVEAVRPGLRGKARQVLKTPNLVPVSSSEMRSAYPDRICRSATV
jgi:hypothetical protein